MYEIAYSMRWFVEDIPEEWLPNLEELRLKHGARLITEEGETFAEAELLNN